MLSSTWYDRLKYIAQIVLPGLATLYFTLASIWGLPAANEVVGTIVAVDTFLGVALRISTAQYEPETHGEVMLNPVTNKVRVSLDDSAVNVLTDKTSDTVTLKVAK